MKINKIIIFVTENNKLFGNVQSALPGVVIQRLKGFKEVRKTVKAVKISGLIVHIANPNSWIFFELLQKECAGIPAYAILAPSVLKKSDDLVSLAKTKNAAAAFGEKNIKALASEVKKTLPLDETDASMETESSLNPAGTSLDGLYSDGFVRPDFIQLMKRGLHANHNKGKKGDWRDWQPDKLFMVAEINWHTAKLVQALHQGDTGRVSEYSADVANYMMKTEELFGNKQK